MPDGDENMFTRWGRKIDWAARVKAVCKPCWELKYCPYGSLVEEFPLDEERDDHACRIFGHRCPVFSVAEPITETRELRNISRRIPRAIQFRVLKRDNQICAVCERSVLDGKIHFDHIIPWSKGGPTEEHNIRLLCGDCNRKRGANFESEYLVSSAFEHFSEPLDVDVVRLLIDVVDRSIEWQRERGSYPDAADIRALFFPDEEVSQFEEGLSQFVIEVMRVFGASRPSDLSMGEFRALKFRWGLTDGSVHTIRESADKVQLRSSDLLLAESRLLRRLGWDVSTSTASRRAWERM